MAGPKPRAFNEKPPLLEISDGPLFVTNQKVRT
jgi:hypothetical protein